MIGLVWPVVAVIWLLVLGEWKAAGWGLGGALFGHLVLGFFLLPAFLLAHGLGGLLQRVHEGLGKGFEAVVFPLLPCVFATGWSYLAFWGMLVVTAHKQALIPAVMVSFAIATSPWVTIAENQRDEASRQQQQNFAIVVGLACLVNACRLIFFHRLPVGEMLMTVFIPALVYQVWLSRRPSSTPEPIIEN